MLEHPEGKDIHICAGRITRFLPLDIIEKENNDNQNNDDNQKKNKNDKNNGGENNDNDENNDNNQNYLFEHILSTESGSSGSPIILLFNERVIGVHRGALKEKDKYNIGSFIGEIVNAINKNIEKEKKLNEKKELKKLKKNKNKEKKEENIESEKNIFKYQLNGEDKYSKLSDTIVVKVNDIITFDYQDF